MKSIHATSFMHKPLRSYLKVMKQNNNKDFSLNFVRSDSELKSGSCACSVNFIAFINYLKD